MGSVPKEIVSLTVEEQRQVHGGAEKKPMVIVLVPKARLYPGDRWRLNER